MNIGVGRVGHGFVKNHAIKARILLDQVNDLLGNPKLGKAFVGADKRLLAPEHLHLLTDFLVCANAHQGYCRNEKSVNLLANCHGVSPCFNSRVSSNRCLKPGNHLPGPEDELQQLQCLLVASPPV